MQRMGQEGLTGLATPAELRFAFDPPPPPAFFSARRQRLGDRLVVALHSLPLSTRRLLAGAVAGAVAKTATAPLEAVKLTVMQGGLSAREAAAIIYRRAGLLGFFRGNALDVLRSAPSKSVELAAFEGYKRTLRRLDKERRLPDGIVGLVAGGAAGRLFFLLLMHPPGANFFVE